MLSVTCVTQPRRTSAYVWAYTADEWRRRSLDSADGTTTSGALTSSWPSTSYMLVYQGQSLNLLSELSVVYRQLFDVLVYQLNFGFRCIILLQKSRLTWHQSRKSCVGISVVVVFSSSSSSSSYCLMIIYEFSSMPVFIIVIIHEENTKLCTAWAPVGCLRLGWSELCCPVKYSSLVRETKMQTRRDVYWLSSISDVA